MMTLHNNKDKQRDLQKKAGTCIVVKCTDNPLSLRVSLYVWIVEMSNNKLDGPFQT